MPNEFVARNGLISQNNVIVSGSVSISGSSGTLLTSNTDTLEVTGSLLVTGSATFTGSVNFSTGLTGSLLGTASYANNANALDGLDSSVFTLTSSFQNYTSSLNTATASLNASITSLNSYTSSNSANVTTLFAASASLNASVASLNSYTSSLNARTSSFATTGSNTFNGNQTITGSLNVSSNITTPGTLTAQTLVVQTITSSVDFVTGSTRFGTLTSNTHQFTGSVSASGSLAINGSVLYADGANVGIGTTSPANTLHVNGSFRTGGSSTYWYTGNDTSGMYLETAGTTTATRVLRIQGINDAGNKYSAIKLQAGAEVISFETADSERMRITSGGNVLLGTTLNTTGFSRLVLNGGQNGSESGIQVNYGASTNGGFAITTLSAAGGGMAVYTYTGNVGSESYSERMRITSGGNVGIGTTSPTSRLEVRAPNTGATTNYASKNIIANSPLVGGYTGAPIVSMLAMYDSTIHAADIGYLYDATGYGLVFSVNNDTSGDPAEAMRINRSGYVGINTTSPTDELEVRGADNGITISSLSANRPVLQFINGSTMMLKLSANGIYGAIADTTGDLMIFKGGNVGIGTTDPNYKLRVEGTLYSLGAARFNGVVFSDSRLGIGVAGGDQTYASVFVGGALTSGTNQYAILLDPQLAGSGDNYGLFANARIKANTAVTNAFGVYIPSAEKLSGATITNNYALYIANQTSGASLNYSIYSSGGLNYFGGNVGIGTTSPSYKLHVVGTGTAINLAVIGNIRAAGTGTSGGEVIASGGIGNGNYVSLRHDDTNGYVTVTRTVYAGHLILEPFANVGIGTTSPAFKFQVKSPSNGSVAQFTGDQGFDGTTQVQIVSDASIHGRNNLILTGRLDSGNDGFSFGSNCRNSLVFNTNLGGAQGATGTERYSIQVEGNSGTMYFQSSGSSAAGRTGIAFTQGSSVGIGTTSPSGRLHIINASGAGQPVLELQQSNAGSNILQWKGSAGSYLGIISNDGNVGIGTTSPIGKQHNIITSSGTALFLNNSAGGGGAYVDLDFTTYSTTVSGYANAGATIRVIDDGNYSGHITFRAKGGAAGASQTERVRIQSDGNVGIGTTNPINRFAVIARNTFGYYNTSTPIAVFQGSQPTLLVANDENTDNAYAEIRLGNAQTTYYTFSPYIRALQGGGIDSYRLEFGTSNGSSATTRMTILSNGSIGIGTTSPSQALHVNGFVRAQAISVNETGGTISAFIGYEKNWIGSGTSNSLAIASEGSNSIKFYTNGNTSVRMMISTGGDVGIGTTSPSYKLDVNGSLQASAFNFNVGARNFKSYLYGTDLTVNTGGGWAQSHRIYNEANTAQTWFFGAIGTTAYIRFGNPASIDVTGYNGTGFGLTSSGTLTADGDIVAYSDARLKENIITVDNAVEKITAMRGVFYNRTDSEDKSRKVGVIAQEIQEILPEVVTTSDNGTLGVAYGNIVGVLIEAIKELKAEIDILKNK